MEQGSDAWKRERAGKATASRMADIMARTKSGYGASRGNYLAELVAERLTGEPTEGFVNAAMQRGTMLEPEAREAYEFDMACVVEQVGFIHHPTIPMSGASPDGLVGDDGMVEIKCPGTANHIEALLTETIPQKYLLQMQWQMAVTGRQWCDFASYSPALPLSMQLFIKRVPRDDVMIADMEAEVRAFLAEVDEKVAALTAKFERRAAA
jgi:putative phage-type endonuclease